MPKPKKTVKVSVRGKTRERKVRGWTLENVAHFIIYRELDKLQVPFPYEKATKICNELQKAVAYRSSRVPTRKTH